jgi:hypothetical protein
VLNLREAVESLLAALHAFLGETALSRPFVKKETNPKSLRHSSEATGKTPKKMVLEWPEKPLGGQWPSTPGASTSLGEWLTCRFLGQTHVAFLA